MRGSRPTELHRGAVPDRFDIEVGTVDDLGDDVACETSNRILGTGGWEAMRFPRTPRDRPGAAWRGRAGLDVARPGEAKLGTWASRETAHLRPGQESIGSRFRPGRSVGGGTPFV